MLGIPFTTRNITVSNKRQAGLHSFVMTPQKWGEATGAFGIVSKAGRYSGTYALMFLRNTIIFLRNTIIFEGTHHSHMIYT